jgi:Prenyltransferase and squalene oxidase repeat
MHADAPLTLFDRAARLAGLTREQFDQTLWIVLLAGALLSLLYLVVMLVTRWGDRHASSKALMFSLLAHLVFVIAWVTMTRNLVFVAAAIDEEPPPVHVREILVESDEPVELPLTGNTPVWEQPPEPLQAELARLDRELPEFEPPRSPERRPEEPAPPEYDLPELSTRPDEPVSTPELKNDGEPGPLVEAAIPFRVQNPEAIVAPEVETPQPQREREPIVRDQLVESRIDRAAPAGAPQRLRPDFEPTRKIAAIDAELDPRSFLKRGPLEASVATPTTPTPVPVDAPEAAAAAPAPEPSPDGGDLASGRSRLIPTRVPGGQAEGGLERLRPADVPTTPTPSTDGSVAVREGLADLTSPGAAQPNVIRPDFAAERIDPDAALPPTYRLRGLETRRDTAIQHGGTRESEAAVEASLAWLARHQQPDGRWDADRYGAGRIQLDADGRDTRGAKQVDGNTGSRADTGVTALSLLAFLGAGYTQEEGRYATNVNRAIDWLISQQDEEGCLSGEATHYARMYCHAMATYALAEAYGMQSDPTIDTRIRRPLERAIQYIHQRQNPDGGWRYRLGTQSDMSMFGWQLMALKSAEIAGIPMAEDVREKMIRFLIARSLGENSGLAAYGGYGDSNLPTPTMTAEAFFCKQMLGLTREHQQSTEAVEYLLRHVPRRSQWNEYYWYYGTMAMHNYGGLAWRRWNDPLRDLLVAEQRRTGEHIGSWDPVGPWGQYGGRVYSTAVATLCLEVYYRFLPLYQHAEPAAGR